MVWFLFELLYYLLIVCVHTFYDFLNDIFEHTVDAERTVQVRW